MTKSIKAARLQPGGGIPSLEWVSETLPEPGTGEVRIRMEAASLNFRDLMIARGAYPVTRQQPVIPLSDGAGVVEDVGSGVHRIQVGDRVTANFMRDWVAGPMTGSSKASALGGEVDGMLAESVQMPEHAVAKLPDWLSFEQAATLSCAGVTAWNALVEQATVNPGDTVLVQGTGGVAVFALQIAKARGARVIATSSSDEKLERMKALGAEFGVNYQRTPDWASAVLDYTGGTGVDHVVEVGGAGTFNQALQAVRTGGTVSVIGILSGVETPVNLVPFLFKQIRANGIFVGSREMLERMLRWKVEPVIDRVFPFADAQDALRHLESGNHFGKVVLARG